MTKPMLTGFLIFPGFPMSCLTSMIEPLRVANEISCTTTFEWKLVSETTEKVASSAFIDFEPDCALDEAEGLDFLVVLSSPTAEFRKPGSSARLRYFQRHGMMLGAVSGGVFPLVRAGVQAANPISVHWCYQAAFQSEFPEHRSSDRVIEVSENLLSAAGAAAAFDLSLQLIEDRMGGGIATEVACWFQHPVMRRQGVGQAVPALSGDEQGAMLSPMIAEAARLFADHLADPISIGDVARHLGISPRHLERAFKTSTGMSPTHYYRKLRMEAARQIVLYTNDSLPDIAAAVGYQSSQTFRKHYVRAFDATPNEERNRINLFRVKENMPVPAV